MRQKMSLSEPIWSTKARCGVKMKSVACADYKPAESALGEAKYEITNINSKKIEMDKKRIDFFCKHWDFAKTVEYLFLYFLEYC